MHHCYPQKYTYILLWRHNRRDGVSNYQPHDCLLNRLFRRRSNKTSKLRVTGLCEGNSPGTGKFPAQMPVTCKNVSIWWRHHDHSLRSSFSSNIFTHRGGGAHIYGNNLGHHMLSQVSVAFRCLFNISTNGQLLLFRCLWTNFNDNWIYVQLQARNLIWKYGLQHDVYFVSASMC